MQVVLIGAGNLATNLGLALRDAGHEIVSVFAKMLITTSRRATKIATDASSSEPFRSVSHDCMRSLKSFLATV